MPAVEQLEAPSIPSDRSAPDTGQRDIRVAAFLPHVPPRPPAPEPVLVLHSVMTGSDLHVAAINGQVLKQGDRIAGYSVQRISDDGVDLVRAGETRRLPMRPLHELPPPVQPGVDPVARSSSMSASDAALTREFWNTFDPSQPTL